MANYDREYHQLVTQLNFLQQQNATLGSRLLHTQDAANHYKLAMAEIAAGKTGYAIDRVKEYAQRVLNSEPKPEPGINTPGPIPDWCQPTARNTDYKPCEP